nr:DUF2182 domain-containing protein [Rhizobium halophytocola]
MRAAASLLREPPWPWLVVISAGGWLGLVGLGGREPLDGLCLSASQLLLDQGVAAALAGFPLRSGLAWIAWLLMLVAMMPLLLAPPLQYLQDRMPARRRASALSLFLAGYGGIWMAACLPLVGLGALLRALGESVGIVAVLPALVLAGVWQVSPWKQARLNECHRSPRLRYRRPEADVDALLFGVFEALNCLASCWALMLVPLTMGTFHLQAMVLVTGVMVSERLNPARSVRWRWPLSSDRPRALI